MNKEKAINDFQGGLRDLIERVDRLLAAGGPDPYVGPGTRSPLEHTTRLYFIDELMKLLGWSLGPGGDVLEEARLKAETTTFMDYVGVKAGTNEPLLIVEVKSWDKPPVTPRMPGLHDSPEDLLAAAIKHVRDGRPEADSPVIAVWHQYVEQLAGYIRNLKDGHNHDTRRAVLTSGQWLVVFKSPVHTFVDGGVSTEQFVIFNRKEFVERAREVFLLLHRSVLANDVPFPLRPSQLCSYVRVDRIAAAFHGLHVHYERSGSSLFGPKPRILVYPAFIIQRDDGVLLTVILSQNELLLDYSKDRNDERTLDDHLNEVATAGAEVRSACEKELGGSLEPAPIERFPGFTSSTLQSAGHTLVEAQRDQPDEWLMVTGGKLHFLAALPSIDPCRFHTWAHCGSEAIGTSAISVRSVKPRAFFTDTQAHHCAHQELQDRRLERCHIMPLDERICCQACVYRDICWTNDNDRLLPCGKQG